MELTLTMIRCPDSVVPEQRRVPGGDYVIGRGADANWVLPDPDRLLSKHHCVVEFRGGGWQVRDLSTNGTFVNHATAPVGRDQVKMLEDGDRLRLGPYEIEVRLAMAGGQSAGSAWAGGMPGGALPGVAGGGAIGGGWDAAPPASPGWAAAPAQPPAAGWGPPPEQAWGAPPPRDEPLQPRLPGDPFLGAKPPAPGMPGLPSGSGLPADFDPLNEGPAMPDHRPSTSDAFLPPRPMQQVPVIPDQWDVGPTPSTPMAAPPPPSGGATRIPDDWNIDLSPAPAPPTRPGADPFAAPPPRPGADPFAAPHPPAAPPLHGPPHGAPPAADPFSSPPGFAPPPPAAPPGGSPYASPPGFAPPPVAPAPAADPFAQPPRFPPGPAAPPPGPDPFASPAGPPPHGPPPAAPPRAPAPEAFAPHPPAGVPHGRDADPFAEPHRPSPTVATPPPVAAPEAPPAPRAAAAHGGGESGLAAFLAGAGLPAHLAANTDPDAALRALGAAFHAAISGLRQLLIARADVKREFRIEQTMLRSAGNNPVKFAASDEQALAALLSAGPQTGPRAVRETVEDLTAHQVATLAATQAAARALLARLAPEGIEAQEGGGGGGLFASKDKRLWEAYKRLHQQVTEQFDDDFDSAFGKEFARAYEQASRRDR
ncbi:type VI secretion system FHA domain protein [Roseomonas alkaliterrae]|uniref:Type VI secretion system FHA domain protein n=3 Tax=Neoroseomonas alkaliterrae TaxID=1452450 RepID=A0A840XVF3_9PROT|nr:type VI secretion system-associated FHA domain protein TagH [Neoroseomonas alkaliterrae]MBB5690619.1 type VI secretion system FHA domain protein [Neoroseomonas alkaliterrae]